MNTKTLGTAEIAAILGQTRANVTSKLTKRPDFPAPYINLNRKSRRWLESEVMSYLKGDRRSAPASLGNMSPAES